MPWPVHPNGLLGAQGDNDTYKIERSLRFNSADSAYLNRTLGSGSATTWTFSAWVKRSALGTEQYWFSGSLSSFSSYLGFESTDRLQLQVGNGSSIGYITTNAVLRDTSAWYHIVAVCNTTSATSTLAGTTSDRLQLFINGIQVSSFSGSSVPSQNFSQNINTAVSHRIGGHASGRYLNGYLTEINFIDGQALTPSSFGETDAITGRWKAKAYSGTYGTNGFYLKFADNSGTTATTLGKDSSPNGNNWTPNNFSVTAGAGNDSLVDSPTNYGTDTGVGGEVRGNYATLNPIHGAFANLTISNGNLTLASIGNSGYHNCSSTFSPISNKGYFEVEFSNTPNFGIGVSNANPSSGNYTVSGTIYISLDGNVYNATTSLFNSLASFLSGDRLMVAFDFTGANKNIWFGKNNSWGKNSTGNTGNPSSGLNPTLTSSDLTSSDYRFYFALNNGSAFDINFGQRPFAYTAPSGYKALCTTNLPTPTIQKPSKYMDVVAYTGTGASNSISSLGFSPDLVWIKNRGTTTSHAIYDTTRGAQAQLSSDTTVDEVTSSTGLTAFGSNGFTVGTSSLVNTSGTQYVAWAWDEAPISGMDIVSYTGSGVNRTIAHNLGVAPKMVIVKARTTAGADQGWPVWHTSIANTTYLQLNSTSATATGTDYWNSTSPTSSVFSVGTNAAVNTNNDTYIAYLFAEVEGFSKFGSYTGNGSADGPFVWCGFRPRWVMAKSATGAYNWHLYDAVRNTANVCDSDLLPNSSSAEVTASPFIDILSNGFKVRASDIGFNGSGATFIFAAFAESPFKYARAR